MAAAGREVGVSRVAAFKSIREMESEIKQHMEEEGLDVKYVLKRLHHLTLECENEIAKIRALELIGKHLGMWQERALTVDDLDMKSLEELVKEAEQITAELRKTALESRIRKPTEDMKEENGVYITESAA